MYASISVYLYGTWTRMQASSSNNKDPLAPALLKPPKPGAKLFYGLSYVALWRNQLRMLGLDKKVNVFGTRLVTSFRSVFWKTLGFGSLVTVSLLGPLIHVRALAKIFEVEYSNDLPPLATTESYEQAIKEQPDRAYNMAWRYSLRWRRPERLTVSKGWIYHDIIYWYLFKGTAVERINNDRNDQIRKHVQNGRTIPDRIERALKRRKSDGRKEQLLNGDRDDWKGRAMDFQARKHESNYESKKFEDPLGIAVYKAFGVGIGYNFDHMSELGYGKEPSPRRLQARAAKSALRRYNELNDTENALIQEVKSQSNEDSREDPLLRQKMQEAKKEHDEEIEYLGGRLTELIPTRTTDPEEFGSMDTAKFKMKSEPKKQPREVSLEEYKKLEEDPLGFDASERTVGGQLKNESDKESKETDQNVGNGNETQMKDDGNGGDDENGTGGMLDMEYV